MVNLQSKILNHKSELGFTLMEIVVATTIFALVATAMMSLFNYTLKINRKTEALRQAAQGMRTFVEGLTKQIRNGQIYYGVTNGVADAIHPTDTTACPAGSLNNRYYADKENQLRIIDTDGSDICFFLANASGSYVGANSFSGSQLIMEKNIGNTYVKQVLNPPNFYVDNLVLYVRPVCDPYENCNSASPNVYPNNEPPKIQPVVSLNMKLRVLLSTGETVSIYYQTTISSNKYDIPTQ